MTRERGEWIPWYCDDSAGWLELSLAARGAAEGIARKMGKGRSQLHLGSRGLRGLAVLLHCRWEELEPALRELTTGDHPRYLLAEDERVLIDPQHEERRRPTSRERMAKHRAAKASEPPLPAPSPREEDQIRREESRSDVTPVTVTPSDGSDARDVTGVTPPCPEWFAVTAQGVIENTGERFGVPEAWIRYHGHRRNKGIATNANDASYWLGTVMVPEARKERQAKSEREQNRRDRVTPPEPPKISREQAKREAEVFAAKMLEAKRKAVGT